MLQCFLCCNVSLGSVTGVACKSGCGNNVCHIEMDQRCVILEVTTEDTECTSSIKEKIKNDDEEVALRLWFILRLTYS